MPRRSPCASSPTRTPRKIPGSRSGGFGRILGSQRRSRCADSFSMLPRADYARSEFSTTSESDELGSLFVAHHLHTFVSVSGELGWLPIARIRQKGRSERWI